MASSLSDANKYVMPAVEDYLAARCLLLNKIFVGLFCGHEAVEKLIKALLILEEIPVPGRCHGLVTLSAGLIKKDNNKYIFLKTQQKFLKRLDGHYEWRYFDNDIKNRSRHKSTSELYPIDTLFVRLYEFYLEFLPKGSASGSYLSSYLFAPTFNPYLSYSKILFTDNRALKNKSKLWQKEFNLYYFNQK